MRFLGAVSIRQKVTRIIMVTSSIAIFLIWSAFVIYELICFRDSVEHDLVMIGELIGLNSVAAIEFDDSATAKEILAGLRAHPGIVAACIYVQQDVFATYQGLDLMPPRVPAKPQKDGVYVEGGFASIFWPITFDNKRIGTVYIRHDLEEFYADLKRYMIIAGIVLAVSLLLAFLLSRIFQRGISKPVLDLARTAQAIAAGKDYSIRAVKQSQDELGFLTESFNDMLSQIQDRDAKLELHRNHLKELVSERTAELQRANKELRSEMAERKKAEKELQEKMHDLERFNELAVGRELKMIEMKEEVNRLLAERGMEIKYEVPE